LGHSVVSVCDHGSLVGMCMQNYKSPCPWVMTCVKMVNIQTHRQTAADQLI